MNYEIRENTQFNSKEIYFTGKPSQEVRDALKALKFRWHSAKKCWYGFADESTLINTILDTNTEEQDEPATVTTNGYLGGGAVYGSKSHLGLYGQDLKKAIAADIKKAGIKGVTLSEKRGDITATINTQPEDIKPYDEFISTYEINTASYWIDYFNDEGKIENIHIEKYFSLDREDQEKIRIAAAELEHKKFSLSRASINEYYIDRYTNFSASGLAKIQAINNIIKAYRFDESNGMVDYFHTNFYYNLIAQPAKVR